MFSSLQSPPNITIKTEPPADNETTTTIEEQMERPPELVPIKSEPQDNTQSDPLLFDNDLLQNTAEEPIFHCNICGEMFSQQKDLENHKQMHVTCSLCSDTFESVEKKKAHEMLHYNARPGYFHCLICKTTVTSKDHFRAHNGKFL